MNLKITLLDHQNNYVEHSSLLLKTLKFFAALFIILEHSNFDTLTKLISNYLTKF